MKISSTPNTLQIRANAENHFPSDGPFVNGPYNDNLKQPDLYYLSKLGRSLSYG